MKGANIHSVRDDKLDWEPTSEQDHIFRAIADTTDHVFVQARAGTGKSTTAAEAMQRLPGSNRVMYTAYNRHIRDEFEDTTQPPYAPNDVDVKTLHQHGLGAVYWKHGDEVEVDDENEKPWEVLGSFFKERVLKRKFGVMKTAVKRCKSDLAQDKEEVEEVLWRYNLAMDLDPHDGEVVEEMPNILDMMADMETWVTFSDMVWLPVRHDYSLKNYDTVFVDEMQDLSRCQRELVMSTVRSGRIIGLGDPHQCIPEGEEVLTPDGYVPIESLSEGDKVVTASGKSETVPMPVNHVASREVREDETVYEFKTESGHSFRCTSNHQLFARLKRGSESYEGDYHFTYVMSDGGGNYRIGISEHPAHRLGIEDGAEWMQLVDASKSKLGAMEAEDVLSCRYGIPQLPFKSRGKMDQGRIDRVFDRLDTESGYRKLCQDLGLEPNTWNLHREGGGSNRVKVHINMKAGHPEYGDHLSKRVRAETSIPEAIEVLENIDEIHSGAARRGGRRFRKQSKHYQKIKKIAKKCVMALREAGINAILEESAALATWREGRSQKVKKLNATKVVPGMFVPVHDDGKVQYEKVEERHVVEETGTVYDLEVDLNHNYFVGGVCVSNSIYQWRGADSQSMSNFKDLLKTSQRDVTDLSLTTTFRCPRRVVKLARTIVPDYDAWNQAGEGVVDEMGRMMLPENARPGDLVLSRRNAPLTGLAYDLIMDEQPAVVQGRSLQSGLERIVERAVPVQGGRNNMGVSVGEMLDGMRAWRKKRVRKLENRGKESAVQALMDRTRCVSTLASKLDDGSTAQDVVNVIDRIYGDVVDSDGGFDRDRVIVLSTVHSAKGAEAGHVYLADTAWFDELSSGAMSPSVLPEEEQNILYVAVTRAMERLTFLGGPPSVLREPYEEVAE
jgi:hypothetical protein